MWRAQRKVALRLLKELGVGGSLAEHHITEEIQYMHSEIDKYEGRTPFVVRPLVGSITSNIISVLVTGERWNLDHPTRQLLNEVFNYDDTEFDMCGYAAHFPTFALVSAIFTNKLKMKRQWDTFWSWIG